MHTHTYAQSDIHNRFVRFLHGHDDIPAFHATFLVGTFLAATVLNIGFFAVLIAMHMALDVFKYRNLHKYSYAQTLSAVGKESLFDVTLLAVALTSSLYLHHSFALSVLSGLSRAQMSVIRAVALAFTKMQILEHTIHIVVHMHTYLHDTDIAKRTHMTTAQKISLVVLVISVTLLCASPILFGWINAEDELVHLLQRELLPWRL